MLVNEASQPDLKVKPETESNLKATITLKPSERAKSRLNWWIARPFDWIATPLYIGCGLNIVFYRPLSGFSGVTLVGWQIVLIVATTLVLIGLDRYEYVLWRDEVTARRTTLTYFGLRTGLIFLLSFIYPNEITYYTSLIIPFCAFIYFGTRLGIAVAFLTALLFISRVYLFPTANFIIVRPFLFTSLFMICLIFILTTAYALQKERASRTRTEQLLRELAQSRQEIEELATTRERNRLARDIHDSLGHYLTVINVQLGKAKAFRQQNPAEAEQALEDARRLVNEALQDVRASVKSLRTNQDLFSLEKSLASLIADSQSERLNIALTIKGSEVGFAKQSLMTLYRVAQEGLTNIQKHSGASHALVVLTFEPEAAQLVVEDNGQGFDLERMPLNSKTGYGLLGLQERLEMLGGQFQIASQPGRGTKLRAIIANNHFQG